MAEAFTPAQLAERWAIPPAKVRTLIATMQLSAFDVSLRAGTGRPRWRISIADVLSFEKRRASNNETPKPPRPRRRKAETDVGDRY